MPELAFPTAVIARLDRATAAAAVIDRAAAAYWIPAFAEMTAVVVVTGKAVRTNEP
ncbi:hypothetical protein HL667_09195 [Bradyrhizobium sp. 83012]|uniref:Uncharacterized protein n=1 Tax=Bradyrhizobium aeschynomenes TaxID=2734909 RepID=A0ABX2CCU7_9BRAD|nr:hypothetical protein [Bradyrhizobium aeschynomenes]NPU65167.1 hypothetical protein [Bradyrhizobium aeschynomenes]